MSAPDRLYQRGLLAVVEHRRVTAYRDRTGRNPRFDVVLLISALPWLPTRYLSSLEFAWGMMKDAAFVVGVVKLGAIGSGAVADSKKYLASGQHTQRRSQEIDP